LPAGLRPVELTSAPDQYYISEGATKSSFVPISPPGVCVRTFNNERLTTFSVSLYDHLKVSGARYELLNMGSALADPRPDGARGSVVFLQSGATLKKCRVANLWAAFSWLLNIILRDPMRAISFIVKR
jgi:hypothetical protein